MTAPTNAQVALQAASTYFATRWGATSGDRRGGLGQPGTYTYDTVTQAAGHYLSWLDAQDARAEQRTLEQAAQAVADRVREERR